MSVVGVSNTAAMSIPLRRLVPAVLVSFGLTVGAAGAAGTGGRMHLDTPIQTLDTRGGQRVTSATLGSGALTVWALSPSGTGTAVVHPCDRPVPANEVTFRLQADQAFQYATFATADDVCLTSTVPLHVVVIRRGSVSPTPESGQLQYVPLPAPAELWDGPTTRTEQVLRLGRPAAIGPSSTAVVVSLDAITSASTGYATAYACSRARPLAADVSYRNQRTANVAYVDVGPGDDLCVFVSSPAHIRVRLLGQLASSGPNPALLPPSWRYVPGEVPAPSLRPIEPVRVLDTRSAVGWSGSGKVEPDEVVEIRFGQDVSPQTTAVVLNLTARAPESDGFVTAWPCGGDRPTVSNLNFRAGDTVPNLVVSKLGPGGTVCVSGTSRTHLIADLSGTFEVDGGLLARPVSPERILDTRLGIGRTGTTKLPAGSTLELQVTGGSVPVGAGAITFNLTAANADEAGFVTVHPCGPVRPTASNVNFEPGPAVANLVTAKLATDGRVCIFASATTHVIADLAAWYGVDQPTGLVELSPSRFLDTRSAVGVPTRGKIPAGDVVTLQIAGRGGVPADAEAVVMNVTAVAPEDYGFLTVWPCDASMPTVSSLNYGPGQTTPNLATVKLAADGNVCIYTVATAHLLADVSGSLTSTPVPGLELVLR